MDIRVRTANDGRAKRNSTAMRRPLASNMKHPRHAGRSPAADRLHVSTPPTAPGQGNGNRAVEGHRHTCTAIDHVSQNQTSPHSDAVADGRLLDCPGARCFTRRLRSGCLGWGFCFCGEMTQPCTNAGCSSR